MLVCTSGPLLLFCLAEKHGFDLSCLGLADRNSSLLVTDICDDE